MLINSINNKEMKGYATLFTENNIPKLYEMNRKFVLVFFYNFKNSF